ncbi:hypothetical protein KAFR_0A02070 [Kazachstania africana CBS 2517]|uniref:Transcriptional repressor OPI1 n=1 Tax=Kazachstania africana (strain ATCC 22294 / BCRC 22015 / CBS 2517 / CECT 1963 / NBRC 1671 / NRRL Y-8276) TaxID=1071382 RepID=H2AMP5_KAZAF|nr:hypothetical protein KAFR_0A02070 [Kazachstania africana CBS 2517]CCF55645.1 hypothetical protein KAFR_0A02070 [Kazachstania africana CBS 2517]
MGLNDDHPGASEEEVEAAKVLDVLRNSSVRYADVRGTNNVAPIRSLIDTTESHDDTEEEENTQIHEENDDDEIDNQDDTQSEPETLLNRVVNNVVTFYDDFNNKKRVASIAKLLDDAYEDNYSSSENETDERDKDEIEYVSKRRKISEALAKSKDNFKEYKFNLSIESKKSLITCLHLLKLANKQLTDKVTYLQEVVQEEQQDHVKHTHEHIADHHRIVASSTDTTKEEAQTNDEDEFFDAFDETEYDEKSTIIKMEIVGTIKKVYNLVSRFGGSSLPEPARSEVRETLLNLPSNWSTSVNSFFSSAMTSGGVSATDKSSDTAPTSGASQSQNIAEETKSSHDTPQAYLSANGKVLILAKESLDVVRNVMDVVDSTLGKAEEWVKQKQEVKEILYEKFRLSQQQNSEENQNNTDSITDHTNSKCD